MIPEKLDGGLITFFQKIHLPFSRFALFVVFFWFGLLKVLGESPASGVVERLFENTIPVMSFDTFFIIFGLFECLIGLLFLIRGAERIALTLLVIHMITTVGPLVLLPGETWSSFMVPTMEGQYIVKNLVILATALTVATHLKPRR
jgi:uncharacterized membrane protein YkgB